MDKTKEDKMIAGQKSRQRNKTNKRGLTLAWQHIQTDLVHCGETVKGGFGSRVMQAQMICQDERVENIYRSPSWIRLRNLPNVRWRTGVKAGFRNSDAPAPMY